MITWGKVGHLIKLRYGNVVIYKKVELIYDSFDGSPQGQMELVCN